MRQFGHMTSIQTIMISLAVIVLMVVVSESSSRSAFMSPEVTFTDTTENGMNIMPASCASSATYYHYAMPLGSGNSYGYYIGSGYSEYGGYAASAGQYFCFSNASGNAYFIPALSAYEMNLFKSYKPPGVSGS